MVRQIVNRSADADRYIALQASVPNGEGLNFCAQYFFIIFYCEYYIVYCKKVAL